MDETDCECGGSVDLLAPQNHVECMGSANRAREAGGASPCGDGAKIKLREPDGRVAGREAEVAGKRKLKPAAEAVPEQRCDHRFVEVAPSSLG